MYSGEAVRSNDTPAGGNLAAGMRGHCLDSRVEEMTNIVGADQTAGHIDRAVVGIDKMTARHEGFASAAYCIVLAVVVHTNLTEVEDRLRPTSPSD